MSFSLSLYNTSQCQGDARYYPLFVVEDMAQDTTAQIKGSWSFLSTTHQYTNPKNTSVKSFAFYATTLWNDLADDVHLLQLLLGLRKKLKSYLFLKAFPP